MDVQERYDTLYEIVKKIDDLLYDIPEHIIFSDYRDALKEMKYDAQDEMEEIKPELIKYQEQEYRQRDREYWRDAI